MFTINGESVEKFGVQMGDYTVVPHEIQTEVLRGQDGVWSRIGSTRYGGKTLTVTARVEAADLHDAIKQVSSLTAALTGENELLLPDGFYYRSILLSVDGTERITEDIFEVVYTFDSIQHDEMAEIILDGAGEHIIQAGGNLPAGCSYTFTPQQDMESVTVGGRTVLKLTAGEEVVIDGIQKMVTAAGNNKFADVGEDFTSFPVLTPGENKIAVSADIPVTVRYYPTYL
ncbi:phage distal tail protein [Neobittarella massiliensis]|uniref:Phage tail protein n=1 Tax=uncultured Anaerotruncus sp. TaxID=905011 RepID=A0A1C6HLL5_9FIRM|nr:hypothetical protein [Neobittarella massiliensis]SCJ58268.1 Phage tail protein [uncultured Anaerotruncus sp.]